MLNALPQRAPLHHRVLALLGAATVSSPVVAGDRVFTLDREGDLDQAVVTVRSAVDPEIPARAVLDPHGLADDNAAAVDWFSPSPDGRLLAYGVSQAGSEHGVLRVLDVDTGALLPDSIEPVRHPGLAWLPDGSAFAYSRLPAPGTVPVGDEGYWEKVYWHVLGEDPAGDEELLGEGLDRTALPIVAISPDGRWLALHVHLMPTRTDVTLLDRATGERTVVVEAEEAWTWATIAGDWLYASTSLGAPRGRVIRARLAAPQVEHWETVVAESDAVIDGMAVAGDALLVATTEHAVSHLWRYPLDGDGPAVEIQLPEPGSLAGVATDPQSPEERAFVGFTSFARPPALWRWTAAGGLVPWSNAASPVDADDFSVEQVFYPSADGTRVPMFLVTVTNAHVSTTRQAAVLSGYGGFAIASSPAFSPGIVAWCESGGLYAIAGIRGGNEYGEDWHRAGMLHNKQNVVDDFAAAADWLVAEGRTDRDHLAIRGGSNGGLLVGATMVQRPDLCRAVVCAVPLLDMLRYHRFLIGALWVPEYGDPEDPDDFATLHAYSPYHRVIDDVIADPGTTYPATLILTAESDSRVDPLHARKFAAALQHASPESTTLLRVEERAGHGMGKPRWKQADELADTWSFLASQLGTPTI